MNEKPTIEVGKVPLITKFIYTLGVLPTSYLMSMTYQEQVTWLCNYIQTTLIPQINEDVEAIQELQTLYELLRTYVNDYFDKLDVQNEINYKLEKMYQDGTLSLIIGQYVSSEIQPQLDYQENEIANIKSQLIHIGNSTPIPVSNINQMTDTSKIYVLTTDGNWYYYDGDSWEIGGTYQSTSIGLNEVSFNNLNDNLTQNLYGYSTNVDNLGFTTQNYSASSQNYSSPMYIKKGTTISVSDDFVQNYHWCLRRIRQLSDYQAIFNETTDTSYTLQDDEYCVFSWRPIDNNWDTEQYSVNQWQFLTNNDITSIKYYYPLKLRSIINPLDKGCLINSLISGTSNNSTTRLPYATHQRCGITRPIKFNYDTLFHIKEGFNYGIQLWNNNNTMGVDNFISDTGWISKDTIIPKNTYFTFTIKKEDSSTLRGVELTDLFTMSNYADFNYTDNKISELINKVGIYNYEGEDLNLQIKHGIEINTLYEMNPYTSSSQGFDIYDNYIVQLYNNQGIEIKNYSTGEHISWIELTGFNHGDTCQFSNEKYDNNDLFPLLYVVSDTTPSIVRVIRIIDTTHASIIRNYTLGDANETGYYSGQCFDFENNLIYSFGYKENSFRDSTNNKTIVAVYDMNKLSEISNNNYRPELIDNYEMQFIYCVQGQKFINGMCYLLSSYLYTEQTNKIYVYDPIRKIIKAIFNEFPTSLLNPELEDIAFVKESTKYAIIIGSRNYYWKITII